MRMKLFIPVLAAAICLVGNLSAATIKYTVTQLPGAAKYRYNYTVSGITFQANQDFDVQFPATLYSSLVNGMAGSDFTLFVFDANNPPGVDGDYSAVAKVNNPSLAGPFSVDFMYLGSGLPGAQNFTIDQFDANGNFVSTISSGTTMPTVPEPASVALSLLGLIAGVAWRKSRRPAGRIFS